MSKYNLDPEKPTRFFSKLNKKMKNVMQFDTLVVTEKEPERCRV